MMPEYNTARLGWWYHTRNSMIASDDPFLPLIRHLILGFLTVFLPLLLGWLALRAKWSASRSWPATNGTVESAASGFYAKSLVKRRWQVEITYAYKANGEWYSGTHSVPIGTENAADERARQLRNARIIVRYNPKSPQESLPEI